MRNAFGPLHNTYADRQPSRSSEHLRGRSTMFTIDEHDTEPFHEDPHTPQAIADSYHRFKRHILGLRHELGRFSSECRQLGRSYALILASGDLREGLENLTHKFYDNATYLSPLIIEPERPMNSSSMVGITSFSFWLEGVAKACDNFRERLNEFREYTDESAKIKTLMSFFAKDLRYRAACLEEHQGQLATDYMRHYIHDLADEMGGDLTNMISAFRVFNEYGMSAMQYEQRRNTDLLLNMTTVATFFSAVTATTLQISLGYDEDDFALIPVVNTFWFCSLVLSIGAALNSLLAVAWKRTPYGSRGRRLPLWVTVWIHASAPFFLTGSIASFSAGLGFFTYAVRQPNHTKIVTLATIAITSFGLITVASWLGYELWIAPLSLPSTPWRPFIKREHEWERTSGKELTRPTFADHCRSRAGSVSDRSDGSTQSRATPFNIIPQGLSSRLPIPKFLRKIAAHSLQETSSRSCTVVDPENQSHHSFPVGEQGTGRHEEPPLHQHRWSHSARLVTTLKAVTSAFKHGARRTTTSLDGNYLQHHSMPSTPEPPLPLPTSFPDKPVLTLPLPPGELQDLEYSPNGELLVTTSYDKVSDSSVTVFYTVSSNHRPTMQYFHHRRSSKQVSWSPAGNKILVRLDHSIDFLNESAHLISSVRRPHRIESVLWLASDCLSAERSTIFRITLEGQVLYKYQFENLLLRDFVITSNPKLLLIAGRVGASRQEILPSNSRGEKQLILYDMTRDHCISRYPILDDVRHVRLAKHPSRAREAFDVLLCRRKMHLPYLWTLHPHLSGSHQLKPAKLNLESSSELSDHIHFIGERDQMMACVGLDGDVHIWDRESGRPMHRVRAQAVSRGVRCFAWRPRSTTSAMFASANDKELKIWSNELLVVDGAELASSPGLTRVLQPHLNGMEVQPSSILGAPVTFDEPISTTE